MRPVRRLQMPSVGKIASIDRGWLRTPEAARSCLACVGLYTGATGNFAKAVAYLVQKYHATIKTLFWEIDTVNGVKIRQQVQTIIKQVERTATVGLHYTGGTKVMAIHTYRTVAEARTDTIFSYLDAQTLTMRVEYADASFTRDFPIKFACDVDLEET